MSVHHIVEALLDDLDLNQAVRFLLSPSLPLSTLPRDIIEMIVSYSYESIKFFGFGVNQCVCITPTSFSYLPLPSIPYPSPCTPVRCGDYIYIIARDMPDYTDAYRGYIWKYRISTRTWTCPSLDMIQVTTGQTIVPLSEQIPRTKNHKSANIAVSLRAPDRIIFIDASPIVAAFKTCGEMFDFHTMTWTLIPQIPRKDYGFSGGIATVVYQQQVYLLSGPHSRSDIQRCQVFDPSSIITPPPSLLTTTTTTNNTSATNTAGSSNGNDDNKNNNKNNNGWLTLPVAPRHREDACAVVVGDKILIMGGHEHGLRYPEMIWLFDPLMNAFKLLSWTLPTINRSMKSRHSHGGMSSKVFSTQMISYESLVCEYDNITQTLSIMDQTNHVLWLRHISLLYHVDHEFNQKQIWIKSSSSHIIPSMSMHHHIPMRYCS